MPSPFWRRRQVAAGGGGGHPGPVAAVCLRGRCLRDVFSTCVFRTGEGGGGLGVRLGAHLGGARFGGACLGVSGQAVRCNARMKGVDTASFTSRGMMWGTALRRVWGGRMAGVDSFYQTGLVSWPAWSYNRSPFGVVCDSVAVFRHFSDSLQNVFRTTCQHISGQVCG